MLRSTTIFTRNVIFAAARTSNSTDRPPLPNGVKFPLETTGGSNYVARLLSSDSAFRSRRGRATTGPPVVHSANRSRRGNRFDRQSWSPPYFKQATAVCAMISTGFLGKAVEDPLLCLSAGPNFRNGSIATKRVPRPHVWNWGISGLKSCEKQTRLIFWRFLVGVVC